MMDTNQLDKNQKDRLVSIAKGAAGALPFIGAAIGELLTESIPNLRFERAIDFLRHLEEKVHEFDDRMSNVEQNLKTEYGIDLLEEGLIQSTRSITDDRKKRLANLLAKSLSSDEMNYEESRKLLNIYNELTDPEIIWLIYYSLNPTLGDGPHADWINKHPDVLSPISREMGAPLEQHEKGALQDNYKTTLSRLGLIVKNETNGTFNITTLGRLFIRYITDDKD